MVTVTCKVCYKSFDICPSLVRKRITCSRTCAGKLQAGSNNNFYGKRHSTETKKKMALAKTGLRGGKTSRWLGEKAKYSAIHMWVRSVLGKAKYCSKDKRHASKRFCWGNISGEYKRDLSDWHSLCSSCNITDGIKIPDRLREGVGSYAVQSR